MKQSAVEWLIEKMQNQIDAGYGFNPKYEEEILTQAKEMEKQQQGYSEKKMKQAFKVGFCIGYGSPVNGLDSKDKTCEAWFNKFKKK